MSKKTSDLVEDGFPKAGTTRWVDFSNRDQIIEGVTKVQNLTIVRTRETEEDKSGAAKEAINSK